MYPFLRNIAVTATLLGASVAFVAPNAHAQAGTVGIDARTSIFSSILDLDGSSDNSSLPSVVIALNPGAGRVLTFSSVTGSIDPANTPHGPDGGPFVGTGVDITSFGPISGVVDNTNFSLALMGVFVTVNPAPNVGAPARLDFTGNHSFTSLSPLINQSFFIGDGLTGTGSGTTQQFFVPDTASFLMLGFADSASSGTAFIGNPSFYGDNHGSLSATYNVVGAAAAAPEPGTLALLSIGLLGGGAGAVRLRRQL